MASKKPPPQKKPPSEDKVTERLAAIVDAAERTALSVIDDAEKEAKLYLEEARARADRMVAERLREEADRLEGQRSGGGETPRLRAVESPAPETAAAGAQPLATNGGSAAARLLATQMAVSGSSRGEIETRLRDGFEIEDTSEILDAILGPEE